VTRPGDSDDAADHGEARRPGDLLASGALGQPARLTAWVRGRVQGVGFRWWVRRNALELGLLGYAENLTDGRVKVVAEGGRNGLAELLGRLEGPGAPGQVAQVTHRWDDPRGGFTGFAER
jgi:acylphosphatase